MSTFTLASQFNRATKMVRVISLSPLARIFQPYVNIEPYLDNPELLFTNEVDPFDVVIQGSWDTKVLRAGEVHLLDEAFALFYVGVDNTRFNLEFGGSGLVYFDVPETVSLALEYSMKAGEPLSARVKADLDKHLETFKALSHKRVIEHCKRLYNSMVAGRYALKEAGKEPPPPTDMELLIAFVLRDEVNKARSRREKLTSAWEAASKDIGQEANNLL